MAPLLLAALLAAPAAGNAQAADVDERMAALAFLVGTWSGSGWHDHGGGRVNRFDQSLRATSLLDGAVIVSEQMAWMPSEEGRVIHHSVTVNRFDGAAGGVVATTLLKDGGSRTATIEAADGALAWLARDGSERWGIARGEGGALVRTVTDAATGAEFFRLVLEPRRR